jgi:histidinol-phosphate aminotransferase
MVQYLYSIQGKAMSEKFIVPSMTRRTALLSSLALMAPGLPEFARANPKDPAPEGAIRLDSNENPYGPGPLARAAIVKSIDDGCRYADHDIAPLSAALAQREGLTPDHVILGSGSGELLHMAALLAAEAGPGGELIAAQPTFEDLEEFGEKFGVKTHWVPLDKSHSHSLAAMAAAINAHTRLIYVCNPNNPSGTIVPTADIKAFIEKVPAHILILVDEAYLDFVTRADGGSVSALVQKHPNLLVTRTFSKLHGLAGFRIGYGVADLALAKRMRDKQLAFWNVGGLRAALASLGDSSFLKSTRESMLADRDRIEQWIDRKGLERSRSQGNFVFFNSGKKVKDFNNEMLKYGIKSGREFMNYPTWARISIGTHGEIDALLSALNKMYG